MVGCRWGGVYSESKKKGLSCSFITLVVYRVAVIVSTSTERRQIHRLPWLISTILRSFTTAWWYSSGQQALFWIYVCTMKSVKCCLGSILGGTPAASPVSMRMTVCSALYVLMVLTCILTCAVILWTGVFHGVFVIFPQKKGKYVQKQHTQPYWCNDSLTRSSMIRWNICKLQSQLGIICSVVSFDCPWPVSCGSPTNRRCRDDAWRGDRRDMSKKRKSEITETCNYHRQTLMYHVR